jgi:alpha-tubulin suppressor-like RCC1 family protein
VLRDDGIVLAFGMNEYGQLGDGSTDEAREPVKVSGLPGQAKSVAAVSALFTPPALSRQSSPSYYSKRCIVDGAKYPNHVEECRHSEEDFKVCLACMTRVTTLLDARREAATSERLLTKLTRTFFAFFPLWQGRWHSLAVLKDGSIYAWGRKSEGQLGNKDAAAPGVCNEQVDTDVETPSISKRSRAWRRKATKRSMVLPTPVDVSLLHGSAATQAAAGGCFSLALDSAGAVWYWGTARGLEVREVPCRVPGMSTDEGMFTAIAAGKVRMCTQRYTDPLPGRLKVESCFVSIVESCFVFIVESCFQFWGHAARENARGVFNRCRSIAIDYTRFDCGCVPCACKCAWDWLRRYDSNCSHFVGEVQSHIEGLLTITRLQTTPLRQEHGLALDRNGGVWQFGGDAAAAQGGNAVKIQGIGKVVSIAAGGGASVVLEEGGRIVWWGRVGEYSSETATAVGGLPGWGHEQEGQDIVDVATTGDCIAALARDGSVYAWGSNFRGQCGAGEKYAGKNVVSPRKVKGMGGCKALAAGGAHFLALERVNA